MSDTTTLNISLFNAGGIRSGSIDHLMQNIHSDTHLLFITETWLLSSASLTIPNSWHQSHLYGSPVEDRYSGEYGISLLTSPSFPYSVVTFPFTSKFFYACQIHHYALLCFYLLPCMDDDLAINLMEEAIAPFIKNIEIKNIILLGDFNTRLGNITGEKNNTTNSRSIPFFNFITHHGLTIQNIDLAYGKHTFINNSGSNIIDFFITSNDDLTVAPYMEIRDDLHLNSDHKLVYFSFTHDFNPPTASIPHPRQLWNIHKFKASRHKRHVKPIKKYRRCISSPLQSLHEKLDPILFQDFSTPEQQQYLDDMHVELTSIIYDALDFSIGKKEPRDRDWKWFWTQDLEDATKKRENIYKKWHRARNINKALYWDQLQQAAEVVRRLIQSSRNKYFRQFCDKLATNEFSKATNKIRSIRRGKSTMTSTLQHIHGPQAAVDHITSIWQTVFSGFDIQLPFTINSIDATISSLPNNKAPGHDHIKAEMLKPIIDLISPILHTFFSLCWQFAIIPSAWNIDQVMPIYKQKGDPNDPINYRPISLICVFRKILEVCLSHILIPDSIPLDPIQGGFRHSRSTLDQALCFQELMIHYKNAYDTVDRDIIWKALQNNNDQISSPLLTMLQLMFNHVQIQVLSKGITSTSPFNPVTGVLQGSTLSPHLYSIYINSLAFALRDIETSDKLTYAHVKPIDPITSNLSSSSITINSLLFADDVVLLGSASSTQKLLDICQSHSFSLGYRWNPLKSAIIHPPNISRYAPTISPFTLYDQQIPVVSSFKYLGVYFNNTGIDNKTMIHHSPTKGTQAMKILSSLGANATGFDKFLSFKFYKCFIRPIFEYGLPLLTPTKHIFKTLETAQDKACRLIVHGHRTSSTHVIKHMNKIPDMADRMVILCAKNIRRTHLLPPESLLSLFIEQLLHAQTYYWKKLQRKNTIWQQIITPLSLPRSTRRVDVPFETLDRKIKSYLLSQLHLKQSKFVLLGKCRPIIGNDPIMYIPMTIFERSRLLQWRMGWLPGKPKPCTNCNRINALTTRSHVNECLQVDANLNMYIDSFLNKLPSTPPKSSAYKFFLKTRWIVLSDFPYQLESIYLPPDEIINPDFADYPPFIDWIYSRSNSTPPSILGQKP
ncbi:hypothetical protein INT47_010365 [Mucor saturninus]|uniref:Reverse transcriptase domain-containing protein n=1 Tax=Mucor saturninus TaxID=64648 RepID=A0A8H7UUY6_9FUNG|nr:hypothetical protein INT47_010365 [Mucor saturninus]